MSKQNECGAKGQLGPYETPRGNHVVRVTILPTSLLTVFRIDQSKTLQ